MGILDRLAERLAGTTTSSESPLSGRTIAELTDAQLEQELLRRRRARAQGRGETGRATHVTDRDNPEQKQLLQYYANLELAPGASLHDVKQAYKALVKRYHPDRHAGDPERARIATELVQSLTRAYEALTKHLERP